MDISYQKSFNNSYMILKGEIEQEDFFELEILDKNKIPGILPVKIMKKDETLCFWYSIAGKENLRDFLEHRQVDYFLLQILFQSMNGVMKQISDYLMDEESIVLQSEYIYLDLINKKAEFSYFPGSKCFQRETFQELMELILKRLNHKDKKASSIAYALYQMSIEQKLPLDEMIDRSFIQEQEQETEILYSESFSDTEMLAETEDIQRISLSKKILQKIKEWLRYYFL